MIILEFVLILLITFFSGQHTVSIVSGSMEPTLQPRDYLFYKDYVFSKSPQRYDIVVYTLADNRNLKYIKRLIGLPGETVSFHDGRIEIDGHPLAEPYLKGDQDDEMETTKLGPNEYFVLGDYRNNSADSRIYGPIGRKQILGRVTYRYWPWQRFKILSQSGL